VASFGAAFTVVGQPGSQPPLVLPATLIIDHCRAISDPAAPTLVCSYKWLVHPSSSPSHSLLLAKKCLGGLGHLPKFALVKRGGFELKFFGGELV